MKQGPVEQKKKEPAPTPPAPKMIGTEPADEKYKIVVFLPKQRDDDPDEVKLQVNGEKFSYRRGVKAPAPGRALEAADHAVHNTYSLEPGKPRQTLSIVSSYPYRVVGDCTREEYLAAYKAGSEHERKRVEAATVN